MREFFTKKGRTLTYAEYIDLEEVPVRSQVIKRTVGSWARLLKLVGDIKPVIKEPVKPVTKPVSTTAAAKTNEKSN